MDLKHKQNRRSFLGNARGSFANATLQTASKITAAIYDINKKYIFPKRALPELSAFRPKNSKNVPAAPKSSKNAVTLDEMLGAAWRAARVSFGIQMGATSPGALRPALEFVETTFSSRFRSPTALLSQISARAGSQRRNARSRKQ